MSLNIILNLSLGGTYISWFISLSYKLWGLSWKGTAGVNSLGLGFTVNSKGNPEIPNPSSFHLKNTNLEGNYPFHQKHL